MLSRIQHTLGWPSAAVSAVLLCSVASARTSSGTYTLPSFDHYQPILDRMPFGSLPTNFNAAPVDQEALKTADQEMAEQLALAKQVVMSAVNVTPKGATAIGFTDRSANPPSSYYLRVGESSDGWTVKSADFDSELATLEKDGVTITLKLGVGRVETPPEPAKQKLAEALANAIKRDPAAEEAAKKAEEAAQSFAERLREREALKTQAERAAETKMREQFEKLARETAVREIQRRKEEETLAEEERAFLEQQAQPQ